MEVILLERVEKLGHIGDVVNVKNGFARNYLLPNKKALRANEANRKLFEANRTRIEADNAERRTEAQRSAKDVAGKSVQLIRQAANTGQPYAPADTAAPRTGAQGSAKDVAGKSVQLIRQASNTGQLYGSVSARDIVEALEADGAKGTKSRAGRGRPITAPGRDGTR